MTASCMTGTYTKRVKEPVGQVFSEEDDIWLDQPATATALTRLALDLVPALDDLALPHAVLQDILPTSLRSTSEAM